MKTKLTLICFIILGIGTGACDEKGFDLQNPNVGEFVSLLKKGTYANNVGNELPDFSMDDMGELIKHLRDTTILEEFPANPISSKITQPKILNECIMWTMDGIRFAEKYPSLEPSLANIDENYSRLSNKQLVELGEQYVAWYNEYKINPSEALKKKDLLANTPYQWN